MGYQNKLINSGKFTDYCSYLKRNQKAWRKGFWVRCRWIYY